MAGQNRPKFVITTDGQIHLATPEEPPAPTPAPPTGAPQLGPAKPSGVRGGAGMPNLLEGIPGGVLPALAAILAAPMTGGMSTLPAMLTTGGAAAMTELGRQGLDHKGYDGMEVLSQGALNALPTAGGRLFNTAKRGGNMIRSVIADQLPTAEAEAMTRAATDGGIRELSTPAIDKLMQKAVTLERAIYDKMGNLNVPQAQADAVLARVDELRALVTRLQQMPTSVAPGGGRVIFGGSGPRISLSAFTAPNTRLGIGQTLAKHGKNFQNTIEGSLRALLGINETDRLTDRELPAKARR